MPTYEYECKDCGKLYELFQSITAKAIKKCKFCGGKVQRLIGSGGGIIFKGSGFYATDYKKNSPAPSAALKCPAAEGGCKGCPKSS